MHLVPFQWEKVHSEGILSSGSFRVVSSFADNTIFVVADQVRDNSFTKTYQPLELAFNVVSPNPFGFSFFLYGGAPSGKVNDRDLS